MELYDAMRTTFAARDYTGEEMPDDVLYEILENARFAPSGGNRQGNRIIVVRDQETKNALSVLNEPAAKRYMAQINAGENPWNSYAPTVCTPEEIEATPPASASAAATVAGGAGAGAGAGGWDARRSVPPVYVDVVTRCHTHMEQIEDKSSFPALAGWLLLGWVSLC